ncbi:MAG TPA: TIGR02234 family membrane protein [Nocardioides bacterium]|uniref:Trp biosynthesis-associated membrane protein n=1 Tax=uncultured Nocardioides sp. TaxID=198441 RepID=UPI000ED39263|nr:Trp biosynthesis-associated membrane protein [uncultured Nocardioides sp.]HCB03394.1 TIGR02234 family membrane protein [Nocardioides sp.]
MTDRPTDRRRFGAVVGAGLAAAALAAVAGHQPWAQGSAPGGLGELTSTQEAGRVPAATALALVVLACWGVLLVTRGVVRRIVAGLALLAAVGFVVVVVVGFGSAPDAVRDAYRDLGVSDPDVSRTAWPWVAALAGVLMVVTTALAVRLVPTWPEMGRRYDAPAGAAGAGGVSPGPADAEPADRDNLDLWKAMDEGRDPTA